MMPPQAVWWGWVTLIVAALADLAIQGHEFVSLKFGLGLLTATSLVYACTRWPRVVAGESVLTVRNPFRSFDIPWGAVRGVFLADSVEVQCARPAPKKDRTVSSWALSSPRRARARAQLRGMHWDQGKRSVPADYGQLPAPAKELAKMTRAEVIARELAGLSEQRRSGAAGQADQVVSARWAWPVLAAVLVPAAAFLVTALAR